MTKISPLQDKIHSICFTGHRKIDKKDAVMIPSKLKEILEALIERGARCFKAGGALGFDMIAALCVLELKEKYPEIELHLILPCRDQTKAWGEECRKVYDYILKQASRVEYVTDTYTTWCMHERNRRLVNSSQVCIAYLKQSSGGTAYTFGYALQKSLEVINIAEFL